MGTSGVAVHTLTLYLTHRLGGLDFFWGQNLGTLVAMTSNFVLNNLFTYRDQRLHGKAFLRGLLSFYLACTVGVVLNVEVADLLYRGGLVWLGAGLLGAVVGAVWNYALTAHFTWGIRRRRGASQTGEQRRSPAHSGIDPVHPLGVFLNQTGRG